MSIISVLFFGFSACLTFVLCLIRKYVKERNKAVFVSNWLILAASLVFTAYADVSFLAVLLVLIISTYYFAKKKETCNIGILIAIVVLGFFKYSNFFLDSFSKLLGRNYTVLHIILPLGLSFYSFSAISYLADVKRGKILAQPFRNVALYLSFYPKITSGPIQRADDFLNQINSDREITWTSVTDGLQIFVFGMFKKLVLADHLSVFVDQVYATPTAFSSFTVLMAAISYSLQIYFDFSGYSDMAVGAANMIGFSLPRNFNLPYLSHNVTELWKRWHISLSSWLQDYLYITLGGSRSGRVRTYVNLMLTMVIGGFWHGANWTYLVWGFLHGLGLIIHKLWMKYTHSQVKPHGRLVNYLSILVTFGFTTFCWIFFRAETVGQAVDIIRRILSFSSGITHPFFWLFIDAAILLTATAFAAKKSYKQGKTSGKPNTSCIDGYYPIQNLRSFWGCTCFLVMFGLLLCLAYTGGSPFIYGKY